MKGIVALTQALTENITLTSRNALTSLNLNKNGIRDESATALAELIKKSTTLTSLSLNHNDIGNKGATIIFNALKENTTLTSLNFYGNDIDEEGIFILAEALKENSALTSLSLFRYDSLGESNSENVARELSAIAYILKKNQRGKIMSIV
jgi:Ran GTPase-activating protein (RanGAP) involved in mRNA processing and transport